MQRYRALNGLLKPCTTLQMSYVAPKSPAGSQRPRQGSTGPYKSLIELIEIYNISQSLVEPCKAVQTLAER